MQRTKQQPTTYAVSIPLDEQNGNLYYEATFQFFDGKISDILSYCKDYGANTSHEVPFGIAQELHLLNDNSDLWQLDSAKDADIEDEDWFTERYFEQC
jgi:hypothetical protein